MLMKVTVVLSMLISAGAFLKTQQQQSGNSMVAKVIQMLGEEKDKIAANLASESKAMAEYTEWCDDTQTEHSYAVKSAVSKITDLTAAITDASAELAALDEQIHTLGVEIADRNTDIDSAEKLRAKEAEEFAKAEAEQLAMVEELEALEVALKKQIAAATTPPPVVEEEAAPTEAPPAEAGLIQANASPAAQFDALLQIHDHHSHDQKITPDMQRLQRAMSRMIMSVWVDPDSKRNLAKLSKRGALIQAGEEPAAEEAAPAAEGEGEEGEQDNLAAFEGLKGKAEEALQRQREAEQKKINEHQLNVMSLKQAVALATDKLDDSNKDKNRIAEEKATDENEKAETEDGKAADEKALAEVTRDCNEAAAAWDTRQKEAAAETAAIEKAKEILASRVTVFLQVKGRQGSPTDDSEKSKKNALLQKTRNALVTHFRKLGNEIHSLAMLNLVSVAASDPMENVKGLLHNLIEKLEKEAADAANLHEFCKAEKKKSSDAIDKKNMAIDKLNARLDMATTKSQDLSDRIAQLTGELSEMKAAQAEATKIRNEEHETFMKSEADYSQASEAVDDAIDALKEYYGSLSLAQVATKDGQPVLGGAKKDSAGGIISILETMGEEFRKSLKGFRTDEREAQHAFDTMVKENSVTEAAKTAEIGASESEIKSLKVSIHDFTSDHKMVTSELGAINDYVDKLKPQCEGRTVPYAERKAKREAEIQGLKEALSIIASEGSSAAFASFAQIRHLRSRV